MNEKKIFDCFLYDQVDKLNTKKNVELIAEVISD